MSRKIATAAIEMSVCRITRDPFEKLRKGLYRYLSFAVKNKVGYKHLRIFELLWDDNFSDRRRHDP
jgi:hypothetical protein